MRFAIIVCELAHSHIPELALFLEFSVVLHSVIVGLCQKLIRSLPASAAVEPTGPDEHHIVAVSIVIFCKMSVLVDKVVKIGIFPLAAISIIDHSAKHVLRMRSEIRAVSVKASHKVARKVRNGYDA